jgi:hypothetical protein
MTEDMFNYEISFEKMKKKDGICFITKLNEFPQMKSIETFVKILYTDIKIYYSFMNTKLSYVNIHNFCITYTFYTNTNLIFKVSNLEPCINDVDITDISNIDFYLIDIETGTERHVFSLVYNPSVSANLVSKKINADIYVLPNYADYKFLVKNHMVEAINPNIYLDYLMICDYSKINNSLNHTLQERVLRLETEQAEIELKYQAQIKKYDVEIDRLIKDKIELFNEKLVLDRCIMNRL